MPLKRRAVELEPTDTTLSPFRGEGRVRGNSEADRASPQPYPQGTEGFVRWLLLFRDQRKGQRPTTSRAHAGMTLLPRPIAKPPFAVGAVEPKVLVVVRPGGLDAIQPIPSPRGDSEHQEQQADPPVHGEKDTIRL